MARSILASVLLFVTLLVGITSCNGQGTGVAVNCSSSVQLNITGGIVCNPIPGFPSNPLAGVNVSLSCDGGLTIIASTLTNSMGLFQLFVNASSFNLANLASCRVIIRLPVNASCIFLPVVGSLQAPILLTGIFQSLGNVVLNFVALVFVLVP